MPVEPEELIEIYRRLARLEAQVVFLSRRMGIEMDQTPEWKISPEIEQLLRTGKKQDAVRALMHETGASLKDAARVVEKAGF
jgi:hypothetical protein